MATRKLTVYLPPALDEKVRKTARDQHRSESSVILEAVKARLERGDVTNAVIEESSAPHAIVLQMRHPFASRR